MKRIIFSIYIDIPEKELDWQPPFKGETESKNDKSKREFALYKNWLAERQRSYADSIGIEYRLYEYDDQWKAFDSEYKQKYPFLTTYNIVNFYKIHLMYVLKEEFDEILYLDLDVLPITQENFFDAWNLTAGIVIRAERPYAIGVQDELDNPDTIRRLEADRLDGRKYASVRSPTAKYWNSRAMMQELTFQAPKEICVFNTGIVGITKTQLEELNYFDKFDEYLEIMTELREDEFSLWPKYIQEIFGWDNETLFAVKCYENNVKINKINRKWHWFMDNFNFVPEKTAFIHIINKEFKWAKVWYEKNCL